MKLHLRQIHHQASKPFAALLREELMLLGAERRIEAAHVVIERRIEASPPFCLRAQLVTPGPDVFADACDHTLHAALRKLINQLETKIGSRHRKHAARRRANADTTLRAAPVGMRH